LPTSQFGEKVPLTVVINELVDKLLENPNSLESPFRVECLPDLWNFVQLSHPPVDTRIDKAIQGRNRWIQTGEFSKCYFKLYLNLEAPLADDKPKMEAASELARFIEQLCQQHSKDNIRNCMNTTNSIIAVRNNFIGMPPMRKTASDPNR
jgi:hypothetical protein